MDVVKDVCLVMPCRQLRTSPAVPLPLPPLAACRRPAGGWPAPSTALGWPRRLFQILSGGFRGSVTWSQAVLSYFNRRFQVGKPLSYLLVGKPLPVFLPYLRGAKIGKLFPISETQ